MFATPLFRPPVAPGPGHAPRRSPIGLAGSSLSPGFGADLGLPGPSTVVRYRGVDHSVAKMLELLHGPRGAQSVVVRMAAEDAIRYVSPKDYLSEILALRHWVNRRIPYLRDPVPVELMRDPQRLIEDIRRYGVVRADCDEYTLLLAALWLAVGNRADFVTVGFEPPPNPHSHVFSRAQIPKTDLFIVTDPVAGSREMPMLEKVRSYKIIPLD